METATEAEMRAGVVSDLRAMSPELVADAIDELGTKVRVSVDDTTPGTLIQKIVGGDNVTIAVLDDGADESLEISIDSAAITKETAVAVSGLTTIAFTGLPAGCNGMILSLYEVDDMGTPTSVLLQLGSSAGYETSGYGSSLASFRFSSTYDRATSSSGVPIGGSSFNMSGNQTGNIHLNRVNGNKWAISGVIGGPSGNCPAFMAGSVQLADELDRIRILSNTTFSGGVVSLQYWS